MFLYFSTYFGALLQVSELVCLDAFLTELKQYMDSKFSEAALRCAQAYLVYSCGFGVIDEWSPAVVLLIYRYIVELPEVSASLANAFVRPRGQHRMDLRVIF